jgi:hypothetical protein
MKEGREEFIRCVLDQMYEDVINNRLERIKKLLDFVPDFELIAYIPEINMEDEDE